MRIFRTALCGVGMLAAAAAAAAQDVTTDHDEAYNFSAVRTYAISIGTSWHNQLSERRVMASLDSVLQSKGWAKAAEPDSADISVVIHGGVGKKQDVRAYYRGRPYGAYRWGGGVVDAEVFEYPYGAMVIDMFDLKTKSLVFRASAEGELSTKQQENQKKIVKAWKKIFKDFPPQPATN